MSKMNALELSMEDMAQVSGGALVEVKENRDVLYLVRQDGTVIGPAPKDKAAEFARTLGVSVEKLTKEEYEKKFNRPFKW